MWILLLGQLFLFFLQGYSLAAQLGHSTVDPVPSLFTFKIEDPLLAELSGVMFIFFYLSSLYHLFMIASKILFIVLYATHIFK